MVARKYLRLGVIGCGRAAERLHLPALAASREFVTTALADEAGDRADSLARRFGVPLATQHFRDLVGWVDAAIVAVPNHLHADISSRLLERGIHVLVEKPMALSAEACDEMNAAARSSGAVLAVGLVRRGFPAYRFIKRLVASGILGRIQSFDWREGQVYAWDTVSMANLRKETGGGVLSDIGSHLFDTLLWWFRNVEVVEYRDDSLGGAEAECRAEVKISGDATGIVELSRLRRLRNTVRIHGANGAVEAHLGPEGGVRLSFDGSSSPADAWVSEALSQTQEVADLLEIFANQLRDFSRAIRGGRPPLVLGEEGRRSVALLEACRNGRKPLRHPWEAKTVDVLHVP